MSVFNTQAHWLWWSQNKGDTKVFKQTQLISEDVSAIIPEVPDRKLTD